MIQESSGIRLFCERAVLLLLLVSSCYGVCSFMDDVGIIVYDKEGVQHLWCEESIRNWIHGVKQ